MIYLHSNIIYFIIVCETYQNIKYLNINRNMQIKEKYEIKKYYLFGYLLIYIKVKLLT